MATWTEDIIRGLGHISGTGTLNEIYAAVRPLRPNLPDSWRDVILNNIQGDSAVGPHCLIKGARTSSG